MLSPQQSATAPMNTAPTPSTTGHDAPAPSLQPHEPKKRKVATTSTSTVRRQEPASGTCFACNICYEAVTEPVVTQCGHLYCWPCLYRWLEPGLLPGERQHLFQTSTGSSGTSMMQPLNYNVDESHRHCPACRLPVSVTTLVPIYAIVETTATTDDDDDDLDDCIPSSSLLNAAKPPPPNRQDELDHQEEENAANREALLQATTTTREPTSVAAEAAAGPQEDDDNAATSAWQFEEIENEDRKPAAIQLDSNTAPTTAKEENDPVLLLDQETEERGLTATMAYSQQSSLLTEDPRASFAALPNAKDLTTAADDDDGDVLTSQEIDDDVFHATTTTTAALPHSLLPENTGLRQRLNATSSSTTTPPVTDSSSANREIIPRRPAAMAPPRPPESNVLARSDPPQQQQQPQRYAATAMVTPRSASISQVLLRTLHDMLVRLEESQRDPQQAPQDEASQEFYVPPLHENSNRPRRSFLHHSLTSSHHSRHHQVVERDETTEFLSRILLMLGSFVILCLLLF